MAAGFILRKSNGEVDVEQWTTSSLAVAVGDLLDLDAGATAATAVTSSSVQYTRKGVAMEAISTSDTLVKVMLVNAHQVWEVQSANNSNATHNGDAMVATDVNTINNTGSNSTSKEAIVIQIAPVATNTDKRILVRFTGTSSGLDNAAS